jgi:hypothetical protein
VFDDAGGIDNLLGFLRLHANVVRSTPRAGLFTIDQHLWDNALRLYAL